MGSIFQMKDKFPKIVRDFSHLEMQLSSAPHNSKHRLCNFQQREHLKYASGHHSFGNMCILLEFCLYLSCVSQ